MTYSPQLARLSDRCKADPGDRAFAALADGLRKCGALDAAVEVARQGVKQHPEYVPGWLALARVLDARTDHGGARAALRSALAIDPTHPVVLDQLAKLDDLLPASEADVAVPPPRDTTASDHPEPEVVVVVAPDRLLRKPEPADALAEEDYADPMDDDVDDAVPMTESLAMVYRRQGHLDRAVEVFDALVARDPDNAALAERRDALRAEHDAQRPRPYGAAETGAPSMTEWLASVAAVRAIRPAVTSSFDAFFQAPARPPAESTDLAAFQAWLKELER